MSKSIELPELNTDEIMFDSSQLATIAVKAIKEEQRRRQKWQWLKKSINWYKNVTYFIFGCGKAKVRPRYKRCEPKKISPTLPIVYVYALSIRTGKRPDPVVVSELATQWEARQALKSQERKTGDLFLL